MHQWIGIAGLVVLLTAPPGVAQDQALRVPVTRDTWFCNVGSEADGNNGGSNRLKLKSLQEMSVIDIDPEPLRRRVVQSAELHVRIGAEPKLLRVTVGSFGSEWFEGTATGYAPQIGSSTHNHQRHPDTLWAGPGSDLCSVILGQAGTVWGTNDASPPDSLGWQRVAVAPEVLAARVAGVSHGLFLYDDTGSEWSRDGETFTPKPMPNRFLQSREAGSASAPYLTVVLGPTDDQPPAAPDGLNSDPADLPSGETRVSWLTPRDVGPAGTVGFFAQLNGRDVPRYLLPKAGQTGERVTAHLRDLALPGGVPVSFKVWAVDGAGNLGPAATALIHVSNRVPAPLPGTDPKPFESRAPLPLLGQSRIAVVDELDKVQASTDTIIPKQPPGYLSGNHLWDAHSRRVRLHAARNEFVGFQIVVQGDAVVQPTLTFDTRAASDIRIEFGRYQTVPTSKGPLPDPIVPLDRQGGNLLVEVYIPHEIPAGTFPGKLTLKAGQDSLEIDLTLTVWDFTLPDFLSFLPEMNCYGLPSNEREFYRLAHQHRTVLNRLPYQHRGVVEPGCSPVWDGTSLDWTAWDRRFGPYLDGTAFADLPRKGVPLECFYLPLHENWPVPMEGNYNGDYWADKAFPAEYRRDFVNVSHLFANHFNERAWNDTFFQFLLNGKTNFKAGGWSRGTSPWLLDEPAHFQDFWALRYFGSAFQEGVRQAQGRAKLVFRADISRPQWQRESLDGLLDYNVVGSAVRQYPRLVAERQAADGSMVLEYGSTNDIDQANLQPVGWCVDTWSRGLDGVIPWQTVGNDNSWKQADPLSLFYPDTNGTYGGPVPSIRLKAYRRGQQDVEYLTLYAQTSGEPRWAIGGQVQSALRLKAERKGTRSGVGEDAGMIEYGDLTPQALWALRIRIGEALSQSRPAPARRLVELWTPPRG